MGTNYKKLNQALNITLLSDTNPCSSVVKIHENCIDSDYYIKFVRKEKSYIYRKCNLGPILGRDRIYASLYFEKQFSKIPSCKKYTPELIAWSTSNNMLIYKNSDTGQRQLSDLIVSVQDTKWLTRIITLSKDFYITTSRKNPPEQLDNSKVLKLKVDLQIAKPLRYIFSNAIVNRLQVRVGPLIYLNHGDLQPKNILLSDDKITVIDYDEGFYGPLGWDLGFLWGNILFLTCKNPKNFYKLKDAWLNYCLSETPVKQQFNLLLFTLTTILFRIYMFPLIKLSKDDKHILLGLVDTLKKYLVSEDHK